MLVTVGTDLESSQLAIEMASRIDGVWATVGVHPHDAKDGLDGIEALLAEPKVVAVGECGFELVLSLLEVPQVGGRALVDLHELLRS